MNKDYRWRLKAVAFSLFEKIPQGEALRYFMQTHITKSLPISEDTFLEFIPYKVAYHIDNFKKYGNVPIEDGVYYEFGAGWDMVSVIGMSLYKMKKCICVDISRLVHSELIERTIGYYVKNADRLNISKPSIKGKLSEDNVEAFLKDNFNIEYCAPCDARDTGLPEGSVDYIASNVTLEHISRVDIEKIMKECRRILKDGGIISLNIDYSDHYSHFDKSISAYNYLQFSDEEWKRYNTSLQYQNRLRNCDYLQIFEQAGFTVLEMEPLRYTPENEKELDSLKLAEKFKGYSREDLLITNGNFVLKK